MSKTCIRLLAIGCLACTAGAKAHATITLQTFTTPPAGATEGPIGFAYAGNKFVGSTYDSHLYSTDLNGGNAQLFGPANIGTFVNGNPVEHFVAASIGLALPMTSVVMGSTVFMPPPILY